MQPIRIRLDLNKEPQQFDVIHVRQGELNAVTIEAEVYDNGAEVDLSQYVVRFECKHVDGKMHEDNEQLEAIGNLITYKVHELVGAVEGMIETAYFSLNVENEDGSKDLYATTQTFYLDVLPNACQEGAGITQAYSSQIEQMLRYCYDTFTENEADRQQTFDTNEAARQAESERAVARADHAASVVEDALAGDLTPAFSDWLDSQKDVEGGVVSYEQHQIDIYNAGTPDDETIGKNESNELYLKTPVIYSSPFRPLDDFNVQAGAFANAGAGWNTFAFPEPFEGVPMVTCAAEGYTVEIKGVTAESFMYRLLAGASAELSTSKTTLYRAETPSSTNRYVMALSYTNHTSAFNVLTAASLTGGGSETTADAVEVKYMAIEYGGDE